MEKTLSNLFKEISLPAINRVVLDGGQEVAKDIIQSQGACNGAIVLMIVPMQREVDEWLGGLSKYDADGKPINTREYIWTSKIAPNGSYTIDWEDPDNHHHEKLDALSCAISEIAYLSHLIKDRIPNRKADKLEPYHAENGYSDRRGTICTMVSLSGEPLMRVYVSFYSVCADEDLTCAARISHNLRSHLKLLCDDRFTFTSVCVDGPIET